jgi:hypothetical protein
MQCGRSCIQLLQLRLLGKKQASSNRGWVKANRRREKAKMLQQQQQLWKMDACTRPMYISLLQRLLHKTQQHGTSPEEEKKAIKSKRNGQTARETEEREREREREREECFFKRVAFGEGKKKPKNSPEQTTTTWHSPRPQEKKKAMKSKRT